jgi:hypothetical protein
MRIPEKDLDVAPSLRARSERRATHRSYHKIYAAVTAAPV